MDDSRIPWWLVVLLAIGVAGLAVWQSSRWKRQIRLGAGALALVYLAMLALAIGGDPRGIAAIRPWQVADMLVPGLCGISLTATVLLAGRPAFRGQLIWFGLLSLSNAGICCAMGTTSLASLLAMTGAAVLVLLVQECRRGEPLTFAELWPAPPSDSGDESPFLPALAGVTGLVLAVALIGTSHHALRAESTRATMTPRRSALPSRARVRAVLEIDPDEERSVHVIERTFGRRADVVVLLAALAFVSLASTMSVGRPPALTSPSDDAGLADAGLADAGPADAAITPGIGNPPEPTIPRETATATGSITATDSLDPTVQAFTTEAR